MTPSKKHSRARSLSAAFAAALLLLPCGLPAQKAKAPKTPEGVTAHRDIHYVTGGSERQTLDLYIPQKTKDNTPLPLIIWVHGGGWRAGSKAQCFPLDQGFAKRGYAIASINYRLTTSVRFPAQIEDCKAAVRWLRAHAAEYNIDPDRFAAWGSSAGGHLVALLGTTGHTRKFDTGENLETSSRVQAVVDFFGPSDFTAKEMWEPFYDTRSDLLGGTLAEKPEQAASASPVAYVTKDAPPFSIWHGTKDTRVPISQSEALEAALKKAGVTAELKRVEGATHGQRDFSNEQIMDEIAAFLAKHLKPPPPETRK